MTYKDIIKSELAKKHWEIIVFDTLNEWWEDGHWKIQWKHPQGLILYIQFLIDPLDGVVNEIEARVSLTNNKTTVASFSKTKRNFSERLAKFITSIENYRRNENFK